MRYCDPASAMPTRVLEQGNCFIYNDKAGNQLKKHLTTTLNVPIFAARFDTLFRIAKW